MEYSDSEGDDSELLVDVEEDWNAQILEDLVSQSELASAETMHDDCGNRISNCDCSRA